ncbi:MAG: tetraacyldisaccharide 4'-kinase [bacterium]
MPDETILLIEKFRSKGSHIPVIVSKNRLSAAKICLNSDEIYYNLAENFAVGMEDIDISGKCAYKDVHNEFEKNKKIAILDDGFTALNIKKNINILIIDANIDIFMQNVLPAGILREPPSALKYADIIVVNKCRRELLKSNSRFKNDTDIKIKKYNKNCPIFYSYYNPDKLISRHNVMPCADLKGKKIITVSAIGNPDYFYENLKNCGAEVSYKMEFQDHYEYNEKDITCIKNLLNKNEGSIVITTLKDYVKLKKLNEFNNPDIIDKIYYLDFEIIIDKSFFEHIYDKAK